MLPSLRRYNFIKRRGMCLYIVDKVIGQYVHARSLEVLLKTQRLHIQLVNGYVDMGGIMNSSSCPEIVSGSWSSLRRSCLSDIKGFYKRKIVERIRHTHHFLNAVHHPENSTIRLCNMRGIQISRLRLRIMWSNNCSATARFEYKAGFIFLTLPLSLWNF